MKFASLFLQYVYGGSELPRPRWLEIAYQKLQALNTGYHLGRFVNCIEVNILVYKILLENQGESFPNAPPLPTLPNLIPGYLASLRPRLSALDPSRPTYGLYPQDFSYAQLGEHIRKRQVPAYSHFILLTKTTKLVGGHVLSGFVVPNEEETGIEVYLYDAQGFLPDEWLHPQQFDEFYTIESIYIYDSKKTQDAVKAFVTQCKSAVTSSNTPPTATIALENSIDSLAEKLSAFIRLEVVRLEAKLMVSLHDDNQEQQKKISAYNELFAELITLEANDLVLIEFYLKVAKLVKQHSHSYNWFDPQSLEHFRKYFEQFMKLQRFQGEFTVDAMTQYLQHYVCTEIIRLSLLNESSNDSIDKKINAYRTQLQKLLADKQDHYKLLFLISALDDIANKNRHWLTFYSSATSANLFTTHLLPLQEQLLRQTDPSVWRGP